MKTILIIEDETATRKQLCSYLSKEGYRTLEADCGEVGLTLIKENDIELVLLDLVLPGMGGFETAKKIVELGHPFLIVSSRTLPMDVALGLELGAEDYIGKPFDWIELHARIKKVLAKKHSFSEKSKTSKYFTDPNNNVVEVSYQK